MSAASTSARPRPPKRTVATGTRRWRVAWSSLLAWMAIVSLGCGTVDTETSQERLPPRSMPQLETDLPEELAAIADGLYAESSADRAYAASQLGRLGTEAKPAVLLLIDCLGDPDWQVRRQAAEGLGAIGDSTAVEPLIEVVSNRDGDWSVRSAAVRSLGRLADPRAAARLIGLRNDMNAHVRHMAVIALGQIGTPETIEPLVAASRHDADGATRFSAAAAVRALETSETENSR